MSRDKIFKIVKTLGTGERLRELRLRKGFSLTELARALGFHSASTVMNYERGKRIPDEVTLTKMAGLYGVTVRWILTGHDAPGNFPDEPRHVGRKERKLLREIDDLLRSGDQIILQHLTRQVELLKDAIAHRRRKKARGS